MTRVQTRQVVLRMPRDRARREQPSPGNSTERTRHGGSSRGRLVVGGDCTSRPSRQRPPVVRASSLRDLRTNASNLMARYDLPALAFEATDVCCTQSSAASAYRGAAFA